MKNLITLGTGKKKHEIHDFSTHEPHDLLLNIEMRVIDAVYKLVCRILCDNTIVLNNQWFNFTSTAGIVMCDVLSE